MRSVPTHVRHSGGLEHPVFREVAIKAAIATCLKAGLVLGKDPTATIAADADAAQALVVDPLGTHIFRDLDRAVEHFYAAAELG